MVTGLDCCQVSNLCPNDVCVTSGGDRLQVGSKQLMVGDGLIHRIRVPGRVAVSPWMIYV